MQTNLDKLDVLLEKAQREIKEKNARKQFDINKQWEKIAMYILNIAYDWNLEDLNLIRSNFPGIDLGDYERHIGVQVSTDSTYDKVNGSFKKVQRNEINGYPIVDDYFNIYFFVPGEKQKSYDNPFDTGEKIIFSHDHIIDFEVFRNQFGSLDDEKQRAILAVLNREICKKPKYQLSAAPFVHCNFIEGSREREMEEIDRKFVSSRHVFLWGLGGIGKTELAAEWGMRKDNVYFVHYKKSITDTVLDMDFSGMQYIPSRQGMTDEQKKEEEFHYRLDILGDYYPDATIIIDNFDDGEKTLTEMLNQPDYKRLTRLRTRFLFTTRFVVRESAVHVAEMDIEDLLKLAKQNYSLFKNDTQNDAHSGAIDEGKYDEIFRKLILMVDRHTLTIDLMSKTLYESYGRLMPEDLMSAFEKSNIDDSSLPVIRAHHNSDDSDYELQDRRIFDHLKILFNMAELDEMHMNVMRHAVLLPMEGIPAGLFRRSHTQEEQNAIEMKIFHRSWLRLDQAHTVISVHPVIREVCRKELMPDDENCSRFLHNLQNSVNVSHDSQELIKPVAAVMENAAETLPDVAGEWNREAGRYCRMLGMYRKAIDYFKNASKIWENQNDVILADIYSDMGNTYTNLREFEAGLEYHEKSLNICLCIPESDSKRVARRYNDMGLAYSFMAEQDGRMDLYEKSIQCYKEALRFNKMQNTPNSLHISNALNNIGNTYSNIGKTLHDQKKYRLALQYHTNAKNIREGISNISPKDMARSYKNIGNDYANLGKNEMALEYRIKALELYRKILHEEHPELASAYQDVGNTCRLIGDYTGAFEYYTTAEKVWEKQLPQNYYFLAKCQYAIGMIYSEQVSKGERKQYEKALGYYIKALDSYQRAGKSYKKQAVKCKKAIGETYLKLGNRGDALLYLKGGNDIYPVNGKKSKRKEVKKYHHLGEIYRKERRFEEALEYYFKIVEIRENYFQNEFNNLIDAYFIIGCIYRELRLPQNAKIYLEKALVACMKYLPEDKKKRHKIQRTIEMTTGELKKIEKTVL